LALPDRFIHLHTHSEYSLLDGAARIEALAQKAADSGMDSLALTDHGVMYGVVPFVKACQARGVKPIVGCELYITQGSRFDRSPGKGQRLNHLLLLAENETGYRNLMQIVTRSFLDGFYYKPRTDRELLESHKEGLIATTACLTGEIPRALMDDDYESARRIAAEYLDLFGPAHFYLELQNQGIPEQRKVNEGMAKLSADLGIATVATNDVHYTEAGDHIAQDVLLCIQTGSTLDQTDRLKFSSDQFYLKSAAEMQQALPEYLDALARTREIADRCDVEFDFSTLHLPDYEVPLGETLDSHLERLVRDGLVARYGGAVDGGAAGGGKPAGGNGEADRGNGESRDPISAEVADRAASELEVIKSKGYSGYFLIVRDFVDYARANGIMVGPGRGSAAGSIVAYALGITSLDPLAHGLLFERFLNPERMSPPDIDIDFDDERREDVIAYVREKYGDDHVAQIITFSTMAARAAIRDSARVHDEPFAFGDKLAKQITEKSIDLSLKNNPELRVMYDTDQDARKILDSARSIEGLSRQDSIHAAGVVISREPLTEYVPLQRKAEDGEIVTQYPMKSIAALGLLKMDFLGLRTLTVLNRTVELIRKTRGMDVDLDRLPENDEKTYELYRAADTMGVFQVESGGMRGLLTQLQPDRFSEIVAAIALFRPGPIQTGMIADFVERKHGRRKIEYLDPRMKEFLEETYGTIVYQEQVMQIAQTMAGFSPGEADDLRAAMGKKDVRIMAEQGEKLVVGLETHGYPEAKARKLVADIQEFAGYAFNKSHSAAYAVVSYQTAYLKAHYRPEFMAALLTSIMSDKDKVLAYVNDCRAAGIQVLPPDVNESESAFTVLDGKVRFGLTAIRNVGEGLVEAIVRERNNGGRFGSIFDLCDRVDSSLLNKRALESLVKAGAFDSTGWTRKHNLAVFEQAADAGSKRQRDVASGQVSIFDLGEEHGMTAPSTGPPPDPEELGKADLLAFEKEMLGVYVSDHPLKGLEDTLRRATDYSTADFVEQRDQTVGWIAGIASEVKRKSTRKGDLMMNFRLEDLEGSVQVTVFPKVYQEYGTLCADDALLRIKARLDVRDEGNPQALAQEIEPLAEAVDAYPSRGPVRIYVPERLIEDHAVETLKRILTKFPGDADVFIHLIHDDGADVYRLGPQYRVEPGPKLTAEIEQLLGPDSTVVGE
jgi:DNA polymerase-3 subunit alpha